MIVSAEDASVQATCDMVPACRVVSRLQGDFGSHHNNLEGKSPRIIVIGDIHGDNDGLLEILHRANLTLGRETCSWNERFTRASQEDLVLVQMGDIVDRGPGTWAAINCLQQLQRTTPHGLKVIRLIGNHELWWMEGMTHMRNRKTDTPEITDAVIQKLKSGIMNIEILGAYAHWVNGLPLLFVHAGLRPAMLKTIVEGLVSASMERDKGHTSMHSNGVRGESLLASVADIDAIASYINERLRNTVDRCSSNSAKCRFRDPLFLAGPERGGTAVGGPFWTDFKILQDAAAGSSAPLTPFVHIVGHSIQQGGVVGLTKYMQTVGVDVGVYTGGRAYLEITPDGHFYAHEKPKKSVKRTEHTMKYLLDTGDGWVKRDVTAEVCDDIIKSSRILS